MKEVMLVEPVIELLTASDGQVGGAAAQLRAQMQATLLMNLAATLLGHVPRKFTYRGVSPMTANQTFRVCGRTRGSGFEGVTLDTAGKVCMRARADV